MNPGKSDAEPRQDVDTALASGETANSPPEQSQAVDASFPPAGTTDSQRKRRRWWRWPLVLCLVGGTAYILLSYPILDEQPEGWLPRLSQLAAAAYDKMPGRGQGAPQTVNPTETPVARAVPVTATAAREGDLGIYLTGLGSVTASNIVTVRPRVSGHLVKVAFQEGQFVRKGDLLAEIDPRPFQVQLAQAEGQMARNRALLRNAQRDLERFKVLLGRDLISKQEFDAQLAQIDQYEGTLKSDQAQIDNAKLQLTYSRITAPISGRIGLRLVDEGNMVQGNDANGLAVITQLQPIAVLFSIPQDDLPSVLPKMQAGQQLEVEAYNRDLKQKLATGMLLTIDNQIDPNTGTVRCKAIFPNEDHALFPNQFVNARLLVDTKRGAVIVPAAAVQRSPQATFVYVVQDDGTVQRRPVVVGFSEGDEVAMDDGLAAGEVVVVEGVDRLQQGTRVAARVTGARQARGRE